MILTQLERSVKSALQMVFPPRCLCCGEQVAASGGLCGTCWRDAEFIRGLACDCCATPLLGEETGSVLCDACARTPRAWSQGRAAFVYRGSARNMILAFKNDRLDLTKPLANWLSSAARSMMTPDMLVVPVPLHRTRLLKRRYNQSALLAEGVARLNALDYIPDLLTRTRRTTHQFGTPADRERNLDGAIGVTPRFAQVLRGRHILLVDDVLTSGATLKACAEACLQGGAAKVSVAVLARVARDA